MSEKIRVVIADDTDIAREGMKRILASETDMEIVGEGATIHETVRKVHYLQPDILVLDLKWFDDEAAGIDAIRRLTEETPRTKIIAITVYPHLVQLARSVGALAALNKEIPKQQLIDEIRSVYALPAPMHTAPASSMPVERLTPRELEVLDLLAEGLRDKEIAERLSIAENTAKNHVSHILRKLDVPNRARAVARGFELGLVGRMS